MKGAMNNLKQNMEKNSTQQNTSTASSPEKNTTSPNHEYIDYEEIK